MSTTTSESPFVRVSSLADLKTAACQTININGHVLGALVRGRAGVRC